MENKQSIKELYEKLPVEIRKMYDIDLHESCGRYAIDIHKPCYVGPIENAVVEEWESTWHVDTKRVLITLWKDSTGMHITLMP